MLYRFKFFSFLLVIIYVGVTYYIIDRLFFMPVRNYSLFESGMVNIFNNYIFLLCLLGLSIIMADIKKSLSYIYILVFFIVAYLITLIMFNTILDWVFLFNLDAYFGFDKFPLVIIYLLSILIGIVLWIHPINYFYKIGFSIIFAVITSFHVGLKDIEIFTISSLVNFPGGNLLIIIWLSIMIIYLLKLFNEKYTIIISRIYGSWLITIGVMSSLFSLLY
jgi:hypothetical protein